MVQEGVLCGANGSWASTAGCVSKGPWYRQTDSSGEDKTTASSLSNFSSPKGLQVPLGEIGGVICLGSPGLPAFTASGTAAGRPRVVSWFQNSAGRVMSLEGNRAPSVHGQAQHRSPLRPLSVDIRPRIAGWCDGSGPLLAAHPSMCVSHGHAIAAWTVPPVPTSHLSSHPS